MKKYNNTRRLFYLILLVITLGNNSSCRGILKGCHGEKNELKSAVKTEEKQFDNEAKATSRGAREIVVAEHSTADAATYLNQIERNVPEQEQDGVIYKTDNDTYKYNKKIYRNIADVPFESIRKVRTNAALSGDEAAALLKKGVRFVHTMQKELVEELNKPFTIIFAMSPNKYKVQALYNLKDESQAEKLIAWARPLLENEDVIKIDNIWDVMEKSDKVTKSGRTPILVFHNDFEYPGGVAIPFSEVTNVITCNSFEINPHAMLTSTTYIDMEAVVNAINNSLTKQNTGDFYESFVDGYYNDMQRIHRLQTLTWVGRGALLSGAVGSGIYATVYFNSNKN